MREIAFPYPSTPFKVGATAAADPALKDSDWICITHSIADRDEGLIKVLAGEQMVNPAIRKDGLNVLRLKPPYLKRRLRQCR